MDILKRRRMAARVQNLALIALIALYLAAEVYYHVYKSFPWPD
jgi:hypothetical protein